ncbi:MAG: TIGR01777 family protein [Steroidobacteraceae bacterium]|nr:TIGR01777 family protein [Steroidobacteraceae bacterium]
MTPRGILVTGGTGFIGGHLIRRLRARGVTVWVWSRDTRGARKKLGAAVNVVGTLSEIPAETPIDGIVNLAGAAAIGPPWTRSRRRVLVESRVKTTEAVIAWCATRAQRPRALVSASAIGFYGPGEDEWFDESSPPRPGVFQSDLCRLRELATSPAEALGVRVVNPRIGLVLGADGGILQRLALAARVGGAAVIGNGRQWMSWIHIDDMVRVLERALEDETWSGPVNAVAPEPVRQRDFQRALTRALHRPLLLRVPAFLLRAGLGEMAELLIKGQRVAARRLQASGFQFAHTTLESALRNLTSNEKGEET